MNSIPELRRKSKKTPNFRVVEVAKFRPLILRVECDKENITAYLSDGRITTIPTGWYKTLREATEEQLKKTVILPTKKGIYWPDLEEFLSVNAFTEGLSAGC